MDQAISYNSVLLKVEKTITKLKGIGLNVTEFETKKAEIIKKCHQEVDNSYQYQTNSALSQSAFLEQAYIKASSELNELLMAMMQYEIYLKTASFTNSLRYFLTKNAKFSEEITALRSSLVSLLMELVNSNTLDYKVEGPLIEDIYLMTYNFIKEEVRLTGDSLTLKLLSSNEVHLANIDAMVRKELETINLADSKYALVNARINKLDEQGIDTNYADLELIQEIVESKINVETRLALINELEGKLRTYLSEAEHLKSKTLEYKNSLKQYQKDKKDIYPKIAKYFATLGLSTGIVISLLIGSFKIGKIAGNKKENMTRYTTFNPKEPELSVNETYTSDEEDGIYLREYSPFVENSDGEFKRTVITYDLSNVGEMPIEEYINVDLDTLGIKGDSKIEEKESLSLEDLYEESYQIIEKIEVNKDDVKIDYDLEKRVLVTFMSILGSILFYCIYEVIFITGVGYDTEAFYYSILNISEQLKQLKAIKHYEEPQIKELKQIERQLLELIKENRPIIKTLEEKMKFMDNNADYENQKAELKRVLTMAKKMEENLEK